MNINRLLTPVILSSVLLVACNNEYSQLKSKEISTEITKNIETDMNKALDEAKLDSKDISVDMTDGSKAIIAANGDLTIQGKKVALTDSQRELTKQYFNASKQLAIQGIEIGKASAKLATQAIGSAIGGLISGENEAAIEKSMEGKSEQIEAVAQKLCVKALDLEAIQNKLITELPAFTIEPMRIDKNQDGCNIISGNDVHITVENDSPAPPPAPPAPPPPAPPEPPKVPAQ